MMIRDPALVILARSSSRVGAGEVGVDDGLDLANLLDSWAGAFG